MPFSFSTLALLILPPLFWAGNAVMARALVGTVPPLALSWMRWLIALALLLPFVFSGVRRYAGLLWAQRSDVLWIGLTGVSAYNSLQYLALQTSSALNVTLIASSMPIFTLALGQLFFSEAARGRQWAGAAVSLSGVLWVMLRGQLGNATSLQLVAGDLWMLAANTCWAIYTWLLRKRRPQVPLGPFLAVQMMVGVVAIFPFAAAEAVAGAQVHWSAAVLWSLAYVALLPSLAAYYCWDRGVARVGAVLPIYFANLTPVFAALLSTWLLHEPPHAYHLVGLLLILCGIRLASRK